MYENPYSVNMSDFNAKFEAKRRKETNLVSFLIPLFTGISIIVLFHFVEEGMTRLFMYVIGGGFIIASPISLLVSAKYNNPIVTSSKKTFDFASKPIAAAKKQKEKTSFIEKIKSFKLSWVLHYFNLNRVIKKQSNLPSKNPVATPESLVVAMPQASTKEMPKQETVAVEPAPARKEPALLGLMGVAGEEINDGKVDEDVEAQVGQAIKEMRQHNKVPAKPSAKPPVDLAKEDTGLYLQKPKE
jgi:hypothetical protein